MPKLLLAVGASTMARSPWHLTAALLPILILAVLFDVYCLRDLIRAKAVRHLPKVVWAIIIVVVSAPWGGLIYLFVGRDRGRGPAAQR
jgi:Phospholipase_D-nuclease N-terminal